MKRGIPSVLLLIALASPQLQGQDNYDLSCSYTASRDAPNRTMDQIDYDWDRYENCARREPDGRMTIDPMHLERMNVKDGLASVLVNLEGWFYVRPNGESLSVMTFDNGPDYWSEGFVRGRRDGKITFFNRRFEEATPRRYDGGWPFENGYALVCQGCVLEDAEHEHRALVGGSWWFIDHAGNRVEHEHLSEEEIARLEFHAKRLSQ